MTGLLYRSSLACMALLIGAAGWYFFGMSVCYASLLALIALVAIALIAHWTGRL
jgi:hypothetical protein